MKKLFKKRKLIIDKSGLQDVIFLVGIFVFSALLIIGLFPSKESEIAVGKDFFVFAIMTVPVIAAIYFIVTSFQRNYYLKSFSIDASIKNKMALAFVFIAILASLPIVFISNNLINQTLSRLISDKTSRALQEGKSITNEHILFYKDKIFEEIKFIKYMNSNGVISSAYTQDRKKIREALKLKQINCLFYQVKSNQESNNIKILDDNSSEYSEKLSEFFSFITLHTGARVDKLSISNTDFIVGSYLEKNYLTVLYMSVPDIIEKRRILFNNSIKDFQRLEYLKSYLKSSAGVFMLILSIIIIAISITVSLFLSKTITKPVLELSEAASEIASGNFNIRLERDSEDELGMLFLSFNQMVEELDNNRKIMYQKQVLEAWREMAKRIVHEIKNPLTPIRLSAERMRKRYLENHPNINEIIISGTDTIIEEVNVLMNILSEFTKFARLPEMKAERFNINELLENCVNFFSGHENISFNFNADDKIPYVYIDKVLIRQSITNIIQNAIDAVYGNGEVYIISEFVMENEKQFIRIIVGDNGIGINQDEINRIFEPGFSKKSTGTGLGLAIVEKIIIEHGGKIYCTSELGRGTEFIIELPIDNNEVNGNGENFNS